MKNFNLKLCTLSGLSEIGRNCTIVEYKNSILLVDFGLSFPDQTLYGIDYMIPNMSYLKKNKKKIKGILITHGHLDHTGGIPYLLQEIGFPPIYAGEFANSLIKKRLKEFGLDKKAKFIDMHPNQIVDLKDFKFKFINITHGIPDSYVIVVQGKDHAGNVFFSGDYKIDKNPVLEDETDYEALKELQGKIDIAMLESTYPDAEGHSLSETKIAENLEEVISGWKGRIVVSQFSSNISRLKSIVEIGDKLNKKIFISGRSLHNSLELAMNQGLIRPKPGLIVDERKLRDYPDDKILYVCTGSQGEKYAALARISRGEHQFFKIKDNDLVILSNSEIPGNIFEIEKMTDRLLKRGVDLVKSNMSDIHASGHGLNGDRKFLYRLLKPKRIIPYHGNLTKRYQISKNYVKWGADKDEIYLSLDGQFWEFDKKKGILDRGKQVASKPLLIDGLGIAESGDLVIKDREQLSQYGVLVGFININDKTKKIQGNIRFTSRGFVYSDNTIKLYKELDNVVRDTHRYWLNKKKHKKNWKIDLRDTLINKLNKAIYKRTERDPVILLMLD